jgi:hypothetical protein
MKKQIISQTTHMLLAVTVSCIYFLLFQNLELSGVSGFATGFTVEAEQIRKRIAMGEPFTANMPDNIVDLFFWSIGGGIFYFIVKCFF